MHTAHAIEVVGAEKQFGVGPGAAWALRGADIRVPFGSITMLVGPSGCGKTTLLSIIAGLLRPTSGKVSVLDRDIFGMSDAAQVEFRRRNMGFIFQQYNLLPSLSAAENAAVGLLAAGVERREAVKRASESLKTLGLEQKLDSLPRTLSGGQQQRVAVARALVHEPRIVLCDEPTAALDGKSGRAVMEMMAQVAVREDRAVLIVTHDSRIFDFAHQIVHMEDGRITSVERRQEAALVA
ncbi:MAG: ATP-binding cassette domain-containing protein [Tepidisphaera sp.]|nr:ATP-binding cassette domain-containing protein [Tepidisphaera sp.]